MYHQPNNCNYSYRKIDYSATYFELAVTLLSFFIVISYVGKKKKKFSNIGMVLVRGM